MSKLPFSYSSSSSSSHHKPRSLPLSQICDHQQHPDQVPSWLASNYDLEQVKPKLMDEEEGAAQGDSHKEHMFDKVVTPSDVGKLNRLVIPKQHAEKYFPLDSSTNDKGLLLNFEDRTGKAWRFRYSYWNSSQSYVMTKGWSRFVKEKKLEAGDIVSFQRGMGEDAKDRLYIDWRRHPDGPDHNHPQRHFASIPWSPLLMRSPALPVVTGDHFQFSNPNPYRNMYYSSGVGGGSSHDYSDVVGSSTSGTIVYMRSAAAAVPLPQQVGMGVGMVQWQQGASGGIVEPLVFESVPVVQGKAAAKRLRLFGVNMDCPISDSDECDKLSTVTAVPAPPPYHHNHHHASVAALQPPQLSSLSHHHHNPLQLRLYNGMPLPSACLPRNSFTKGSHPCP